MSLSLFMEHAEVNEGEASAISLLQGTQPVVKSQALVSKLGAGLASVRAMVEPDKPYLDLFNESKAAVEAAEDPRALFAPYAEQYKTMQTEQLKARAITRIKNGEDAGVVLQHLAATKQLFDNTNQWDANVLIRGVQTAVPFDVYEQMDRAADARPYQLLQDRTVKEGRDGVDAEDFADVASLLFVPDNILQDVDVLARVNKTGLLSANSLPELGNKYRSLTPAEKEMFWEAAFPIMYEEFDGNDSKVKLAIERIQSFDPEAERDMTAALDVLTGVGSVFDSVALYKGAKILLGVGKTKALEAEKTRGAVQNLRDAGAPGKAADAELVRAAEASAQEERLAAGMNASPYNFEGTVLDNAHVVDGLAPEISARLQQGMDNVQDLDGALIATERAVLEQRAAELDIWVEEQLAATGGRSEKEVRAELEALRAQRKDMEYPGGRTIKKYTENAADADSKIARLEEILDKVEAAKLGKQYARTMRAGRVPAEFSEDVRAAQGQLIREWEGAPVNDSWRIRKEEQAAQEAEIRKMQEELGIQLAATPKLSTQQLTALKVQAARVNQALNIAKAEQRSEDVARLEKAAAEIRAAFEQHQEGTRVEEQLRALDLRELNKDQRARLREVVQGVRNTQAKPTKLKEDPTLPPKQVPEKPARYSENDAVEAAVGAGVKVVQDRLQGFKSGEGFIDVARMQFARNKVQTASEEFAKEGRSIRSAEVTKIDADGLEVTYTLEDGVTTAQYRWDLDSMGDWSVQELNRDTSTLLQAAATNVLSPQAMFKGLDKDIVSNLTLGGMQTSAIYNNLTKVAKSIFKDTGLTKEQTRLVEELLMHGDLKNSVYTADELLYTNSVLNRKWQPEEVMAYFQWRAFYDNLADIQNAAVHRMLSFQGYRELRVKLKTGDLNTMLRKATDEEFATIGSRKVVGKDVEVVDENVLVMSDSTQELQRLPVSEIHSSIDAGYGLYRLYHHEQGGTKVVWALVKPGENVQVQALRTQVLHKVTGYIPRVYKPGMFFIKDQNFRTVAGFPGRKEAEAWLRHVQDKFAGTGIQEKYKLKYQVFEDRALPPDSIELDRLEGLGGLWFMPRRGDPVLNPYREQVLDRLDLGAATQTYLNNIAEMLPLNEYRHGLVRQFQKAAQAVGSKHGKDGLSDITDPLNSRIDTGDKSADTVLSAAREYIVHQISQQTTEEGKYSAFMGAVVDLFEGKPVVGGVPRDFVKWARSQDPISRAKAGVFHAYLGSMNFAQLFVQAQNAVVAGAVYPWHAPGAFLDSLKMRTVFLMDQEAVEALAMSSKIELGSAKADMAALKRSGYFDSIYRQDAFQSQLQGFGGNTIEGVRKLLRGGAIPFEEGELFSRLMAFNIAKREYLLQNKGKKALTDLDIHAIVQNSLRINLNLQKENAAVWQTNAFTAIPSQFLQVQAKFAEQVFGGLFKNTGGKTGKHTGLTRGEASRALVGQLAMYGVVGVPLGEQLMKYAAKAQGYVFENGEPDVQRMYIERPEMTEALGEGALGYGMHVLGINTNVSERFSILAGLDDNIVLSVAELVINTGDPVNQAKIDLGDLAPGVGVFVRGKDAATKISDNIRTAVSSPEVAPQAMIGSVKAVANIASSFNNYEKLRLWRAMGVQYSKAANATVEWKDTEMNFQTELARGLGFPTDSEHLTWQLAEEVRDQESVLNQTKFLIRKSFLARADGNAALADVLLSTSEGVLNNPVQHKIVLFKEFEKMYSGETMEHRVSEKSFKNWLNGYDVNSNLSEASK